MPTLEVYLNQQLADVPPSKVVAGTALALGAAYVGYKILAPGNVLPRLVDAKNRTIRAVLASYISRKIAEANGGKPDFPRMQNEVVTTSLPDTGLSPDEAFKMVSNMHSQLDRDFRKGGMSGTVYHGGLEHTKLMNRVMEVFQWSNPLHLDAFGAIRKMETEIIEMTLDLFNGSARPDACGSLTSGGTESIGMAMKVYRDLARQRGITETPEVILPRTAHPAFDKAANYYGLRLIKTPTDPVTGRALPKVMEKYISHRTIALVGSAPCFPYGCIDPISELSDLAVKYNIGLHVDACLGSYIVTFMERAGFSVPLFDFRLRGVTSISCDTHKYGFSVKGTSVVMYATKELRRLQYFTTADWPGGCYLSPHAAGSRPGNVIAATWVALMSIGKNGYTDACRGIVTAARKLHSYIRTSKYLYTLGTCDASVVSFSSDVVDVYELSDRLKKRNWYLNPLQFPHGLQFSLTLMQSHPGVIESFIADLDACVEELATAASTSAVKVNADGSSIYGSQQKISDRSILQDIMRDFLDQYHNARITAK